MDSGPTAESQARNRHPGKLLLLSICAPPYPIAVAYVEDNLSQQFTPDEMVWVSPSNPGTPTYRRDPAFPPIEYVGCEWTWPKRGKRFVHWVRWFLLPRLVARIKRIAVDQSCDSLMVVFPDEYFLTAGYLAAKSLGLKFYPHFHNTYLDNRTGLARRFAQWLQPRVFAQADVVFTMSDGMKQVWNARYPGVHFEPLVHTFNGDIPSFQPLPPLHEPLRLAYMGNLNDSNLDAMRRLAHVIDQSPNYLLTIYSGTPQSAYANNGIAGQRIVHERASDEELRAKLQSNDILLLPHGLVGGLSQMEYDTIFPTRTIPYLTSVRPMLAHSPPDCFLTRWLRQHDCAEIVEIGDVAEIIRAIERLRHDPARREQLVRNALRASEMFHAPTVVANLKRIMAEGSSGATAALSSATPLNR